MERKRETKRETGWCFYLLISLCLFFLLVATKLGDTLQSSTGPTCEKKSRAKNVLA